MSGPLLLALDPSIVCLGEAVVGLLPPHDLIEAGFCATEPRAPMKPKLAHVRDQARRGGEVSYYVRQLLAQYGERIAFIALEAPLGSQDVVAAELLARANQAVFDAIDTARPDLVDAKRVMFVSSYGAKAASTGEKRPEDPKGAVARAVIKRWGAPAWDRALRPLMNAAQRQAAYDAGAVALCALEQPYVQTLIAEELARASTSAPQPMQSKERPTWAK